MTNELVATHGAAVNAAAAFAAWRVSRRRRDPAACWIIGAVTTASDCR